MATKENMTEKEVAEKKPEKIEEIKETKIAVEEFGQELDVFEARREREENGETIQREGQETIFPTPVNVQRHRSAGKDGKQYDNYAVGCSFATGRKNEKGEDEHLNIQFNVYPLANREALYKALYLAFGDSNKCPLEIIRTIRQRTDQRTGQTTETTTYSMRVSGHNPVFGEFVCGLRTNSEGDRALFNLLISVLKNKGFVK